MAATHLAPSQRARSESRTLPACGERLAQFVHLFPAYGGATYKDEGYPPLVGSSSTVRANSPANEPAAARALTLTSQGRRGASIKFKSFGGSLTRSGSGTSS